MDMEQLRKMFYEECRENLAVLEEHLLNLNPDQLDKDSINTVFRAAHSIKGGAATFNLFNISEFTHTMEAYLDTVRTGQNTLSAQSVDVLLRGCDCILAMLEGHESGAEFDHDNAAAVTQQLESLLVTEIVASSSGKELTEAAEAPSLSNVQQPDSAMLSQAMIGEWHIDFQPHPSIFFSGNDPLRILREITDLDSDCDIHAFVENIPDLHALEEEMCYVHWRITVSGKVDKAEIDEVFEWVEDECDLFIRYRELDISPLGVPEKQGSASKGDAEWNEDAQSKATSLTGSDADMASEANTSQAAVSQKAASETTVSKTAAQQTPVAHDAAVTPNDQAATSSSSSQASTPKPPLKSNKPEAAVTSIRVDIDKVDNLINLVGELVITQSMLNEIGQDFSIDKLDKLKAGLVQLLQNSKDLQENVLNIRMLPMSFAFSRFPRLVRDLSSRLGKQVELTILGESTELDKTVLERIVDPLVHLVRNGIDHGIEMPEQRREQGKDACGQLTLNAYHQGGSIIIEVKDDGGGIDGDRLWSKALEKGVLHSDSRREDMSHQQVLNLIFAPGFSTAEEVSDISGRGVGMDVVKRNIEELGGHIEVTSQLGVGSAFTISLPLTLAILDGQLIRVGGDVYVIPLLTIIESIQIDPDCIKHAAGGMELYRLRERNIPILRLQDELEMGCSGALENKILCFVEAAGNQVGLLLDELLDQQQVVIKSLDSNYSKVAGISGATILGDGSVSLILDIQGLITGFLKRRNDSKGTNGVAA